MRDSLNEERGAREQAVGLALDAVLPGTGWT